MKSGFWRLYFLDPHPNTIKVGVQVSQKKFTEQKDFFILVVDMSRRTINICLSLRGLLSKWSPQRLTLIKSLNKTLKKFVRNRPFIIKVIVNKLWIRIYRLWHEIYLIDYVLSSKYSIYYEHKMSTSLTLFPQI